MTFIVPYDDLWVMYGRPAISKENLGVYQNSLNITQPPP